MRGARETLYSSKLAFTSLSLRHCSIQSETRVSRQQMLAITHSALHLIHAGLITSKFSLRHKKTALACACIPERCAVCIAAGYGICARMRLSATTASDPERPQWCMEACIQIPGHTVQYGPCLPQDRRIHHVSECIAHAPMRLSGSMQLNTTLMQ